MPKSVRKTIAELSHEELKLGIKQYAWCTGYHISPEKNLDAFVARQKTVNHCACVNTRLFCPCLEVDKEMKDLGHCCCWLFLSDARLREVKLRIKRKVEANPSFNPER